MMPGIQAHLTGLMRTAADRRWVGIALALAVLTAATFATLATAAESGTTTRTSRSGVSSAVEGQWAVEVDTPAGRLPFSIVLRSAGQGGILVAPGGTVEVEYRQEGEAFSIAARLPRAVSPTGSSVTMMLRGVQVSERAALGTAVFFEDVPHAEWQQLEQTTGSFSAIRQ
jgi:hypothetical protein